MDSSNDSDKQGSTRIAYPGKTYFQTAIALIDRNESFIAVVEGKKAKNIYTGSRVYVDFFDCFVRLSKPKSRRILWRFFWVGLSDISFWTICIYGQHKRKEVAFNFNGERLEVIFDFGSVN